MAIPAHNEADRIMACLAALAMQRDSEGTPLPRGSFDVLILANNCTDATAEMVRAFAEVAPFPLHTIACSLPRSEAHAGGARRAAMDHAAERLASRSARDGVILTTDADSRAQPTWIAATWAGFAAGADAVAGYIDADPNEYLALGVGFLARGRLEDRFLARLARLYALLDPRRHDPWPNHGVHSGAAFAVSLLAYRTVGGLPVRALGEDAALAQALEEHGFLLRHSVDAAVTTSCRFDSRALGGAGDTMRARHADLEAYCDVDVEPVARLFRRARTRGHLRRLHANGRLADVTWAVRLGLDPDAAAKIVAQTGDLPFAHLWRRVEGTSPVLRRGAPLRPADLPREIATIERLLRRVEAISHKRRADPTDMPRHAETRSPASAAPVPR